MSLALIIMAVRVPLENEARSLGKENPRTERAQATDTPILYVVQGNRTRPFCLDHLTAVGIEAHPG
jgi:hypothetical protein